MCWDTFTLEEADTIRGYIISEPIRFIALYN